jgi:hypothetical protein
MENTQQRFARIDQGFVREVIQVPSGVQITDLFHPELAVTFRLCGEMVEHGWSYENEIFAPPATPPERTPEEKRAAMPNLTARQLRLGLLHLGKLSGVPSAIAALSEPEKSQAEIEWDYASEFRRLHPLIVRLIPILGLTDEQVDPVWLEFAQV